MKKIIFIALVAAISAPIFIKGPDGDPIMSISDWIPEKLYIGAISGDSNALQEFYRYQDEQGNWQYTNHPPEGTDAELVEVDTRNVVQSVDIKPKTETDSRTSDPDVAGYVDHLKNFRQNAENIQNLMDNREGQLQEMLNRSQ